MSDGAYAGLRRAARAGKPGTEPETPETETEDGDDDEASAGKKKDMKMSTTDNAAALAAAKEEGRAEGAAATHQRYAAVMASEHYEGREGLAMKLLGNDKLGADEIIETLSAAEKKPAAAALTDEQAKAAAEEAGRKEMQAALQQQQNSNVDAAVGGTQPDTAATASNIWDKAIASLPGTKAA